jgi:hypothetical protein
MPHSDFADQAEQDRTQIVTRIRKGFEELAELMTQLQRCLVKRERSRRMLTKACRALVRASETSDLPASRRLLAEALYAAKLGLAEIDSPEPATTPVRHLETAAD